MGTACGVRPSGGPARDPPTEEAGVTGVAPVVLLVERERVKGFPSSVNLRGVIK